MAGNLAKPGQLLDKRTRRPAEPKGYKRPRMLFDFIAPPVMIAAETREWRMLPRYPDYEISNDGRLRRSTPTPTNNHRAGKIIKPRIFSNGYVSYGLMDISGKRQTVSAHRLVALAFLPAPAPNQMLVLHRNDNRLDIRSANLRWGTAFDNAQDAKANGRHHLDERHPCRRRPWTRPRGAANTSAKLTEDEVKEILVSNDRQRDIAARYGVDQALVGRIRTGKVWKHITNPEYAAMLKAGASTEVIVRTRRKRINTKERLAILVRENGACHLCGGKIQAGEAWDVSHEIPLELGGADDVTNWRAAHRKCHQSHTARVDMPAIAKAKRVQARHFGAKAPSSRPMPGGRKSPWRKKMNGEVVRR